MFESINLFLHIATSKGAAARGLCRGQLEEDCKSPVDVPLCLSKENLLIPINETSSQNLNNMKTTKRWPPCSKINMTQYAVYKKI